MFYRGHHATHGGKKTMTKRESHTFRLRRQSRAAGTALLLAALLPGCSASGRDHLRASGTRPARVTTSGGKHGSIPSSLPPRTEFLADDRDADRDDDGSANHYLTPARHGEDTYISAADGDLADQTERDAVSAVLRHYYTAAAAGDGTIACTMLAPSMASGLAEGQAQSGQRRAPSPAAPHQNGQQ